LTEFGGAKGGRARGRLDVVAAAASGQAQVQEGRRNQRDGDVVLAATVQVSLRWPYRRHSAAGCQGDPSKGFLCCGTAWAMAVATAMRNPHTSTHFVRVTEHYGTRIGLPWTARIERRRQIFKPAFVLSGAAVQGLPRIRANRPTQWRDGPCALVV